MEVDVYHSGIGKTPRPPFMFVRVGALHLPRHPAGELVQWNFWKRSLLKTIAVVPTRAEVGIMSRGYFIQ